MREFYRPPKSKRGVVKIVVEEIRRRLSFNTPVDGWPIHKKERVSFPPDGTFEDATGQSLSKILGLDDKSML